MDAIKVYRYPSHPNGHQGYIEPESKTWRLVIDAEGLPHFFVTVIDEVTGSRGVLNIDFMLESEGGLRSLVGAVFSGELTPEEEAEAHAEYMASAHLACPQ